VLTAIAYAQPLHADDASWRAPIGIPVPEFGIVEQAPATPANWLGAQPGFYYVDASNSRATDQSNPYGYPGRPRRTIPASLPAGAVVEVHGVYGTSHTSPNGIAAAGNASQPVFIRGVSDTDKPRITGCWEVTSSYLVIENIEFSDC